MLSTLVCMFLDETRSYAYGVEFGMLFARMRFQPHEPIEDIFTTANKDQILLLASREKWQVDLIEPVCEGWFKIRMTNTAEEAT